MADEEKDQNQMQSQEPEEQQDTRFTDTGEVEVDFTDQLSKLLVGEEPAPLESEGETEEQAPEGEEGVEEAVAEATSEEDIPLSDEEIEQGIDEILSKIEGGGEVPPELQEAKQLYDLISSDPEIFGAVVDKLKEKSQGGGEQEPVVPQPEIPDIPKPEDFDPTEAMDPNTPSGKWYMAQVARQISTALSPVFGTLAQKVSTVEQFINAIQQEEVRRQQKEQVARVLGDFISNHPEAEKVADDFVRFLENPTDVTMEDMWEVYAKKRGLVPQAVQEYARKETTPPEAPPASTLGGANNRMKMPEKKDLGDALSDLLLGANEEY